MATANYRRLESSHAMGACISACLLVLSGCSFQTEEVGAVEGAVRNGHSRGSRLAREVKYLAAANDVTPIPPAPEVRDELFDLGQALIFDKELSGDRNISCMTCHFSTLDTVDERHLSSGIRGLGLGEDRVGGNIHPRNTQPLFNLHTLDRLFWDGRVEIDGSGNLSTPAAPGEITPEMEAVFEFGVVSAQAMFPAIQRNEMRGHRFTNGPNPNEMAGDLERPELWAAMMTRLGAFPEYRALFEAAYPGTDFDDMTFAHAANAMAGFEIRAFESRGSRFQQFLEGDLNALSRRELRGAREFFENGCADCHSGPSLSDMNMHNTGLAQFGPGTGDGLYENDDFGRAGVEGPLARGGFQESIRDRFKQDGLGAPPPHTGLPGENPLQLYAFRTPPLTNVTLTGPWGHLGQFTDLGEFIEHYEQPADNLVNYNLADHILPSEFPLLDVIYPNTNDVLPRIDPRTHVAVGNMRNMLAFMETLTDDAARDLSWTVPPSVPSGLPLTEEAPEDIGVAEGTVHFANLAEDPSNGLSDYRRVPSERAAIAEAFLAASVLNPQPFPAVFDTPLRWRGAPGLAIFDFDGDGDEDVYATNGPGEPNSLMVNQLAQCGQTRFEDGAAAAGVEAMGDDTDSTGVCYGDIDNDGDADMFVVAHEGASHFFRNNGDGTFEDISAASGAATDGIGGTSCAFGDIDNDGLLDLAVVRAWSQDNNRACFLEPFSTDIQHNELFHNEGGGIFTDVSDVSGFRNLGGLPPFAAGAASITWAVSLVDYDLDGDVDIFTADDQCALPTGDFVFPDGSTGLDRGFLQIFENDGTGNFTNVTVEAGTNVASAWMGLSFGDFNSDGHLDFFSPSFGDWGKLFAGAPVILGSETARWLLGNADGTFTDPGVGDLGHMPFGWGTSARDFDNDGDTDITFHGGMDLYFHVDRSNPGSMLLNDGGANFGLDRQAFDQNHARRNDSGVAAGDLNGDGFTDLVTVSNFDVPIELPLMQYGGVSNIGFYSAFDPTAYLVPTMELIEIGPESPATKGERRFSYQTEFEYDNGTLAVEISSGDNGNGWASIRALGTVGITTDGVVNRDGIGAMMWFTPRHGSTVMAPVLGGSSHESQDSLTQGFGLGDARRGTLEVLWPGGHRNRLYNVRHGDVLQVPEIPCSFDTDASRSEYRMCVDNSLDELRAAGVIRRRFANRLRRSAMRAYREAH